MSCQKSKHSHSRDVEIYSISNDSMLIKCKDLKGLTNFEIGKTTYLDALKDPNFFGHNYQDSICAAYLFYYGLPPTEVNYREDYYIDSVMYDYEFYSKYAEMTKLASAKRLHTNVYKNRYSDFNNLVLDFYKDTLVCIEYSGNDNVLYLYQNKYGNGRGKHIMSRECNIGYNNVPSINEVDTTNVIYFNKNVIVNIFETYDRISKYWYHHVMITDRHGKYKEYCKKIRSVLNALDKQEDIKSKEEEKKRINQV